MGKTFVYDKGVDLKHGKGKNITYSVFFDGTLNNRKNTEDGKAHRDETVAHSGQHYDSYLQQKKEDAAQKDIDHSGKVYDGGELKEVIIAGKKYNLPKGDSYKNDYTNVARLYYAYNDSPTIHERIYVEGVGTEDHLADDDLATGMGVFSTSVRGKAKKAYDQIFDNVVKIVGKVEDDSNNFIETLTIDVYGFSRGATTARYFTHFMTTSEKSETAKYYEYNDMAPLMNPVIEDFKNLENNFKFLQNENLNKIEKLALIPLAKKKTEIDLIGIGAKIASAVKTAFSPVATAYFQEKLRSKGIKVNHLNIRFLGLFDTVSSYGIFHDNDVKDLGLDAVNKAQRTIHLTAGDEYRKNFALTNIRNAGFRGVELTLPGVHCDIGGAYNTVEYEKTAFYITSLYDELGIAPANLILGPVGSMIKEAFEPNARKFRKQLINKGWLKDEQVEFIYENWLGSGTKTVESIILLGIVQDIIRFLPPVRGIKYLKEINNKSLEGLQIGLPPFGILYGHRLLSNKYSFIPLNMMADFSVEMGVPINKGYFSSQGWTVPADLQYVDKALNKYKNKVINLHNTLKKEHDDEELERMKREGFFEKNFFGKFDDFTTSDKQKKYIDSSNEISYKDFLTDEKQLHHLRNNYLHWSAKSDNFGLDPVTRSENFENRRVIHNG